MNRHMWLGAPYSTAAGRICAALRAGTWSATVLLNVLKKLKRELRELRSSPAGERFTQFHERHRHSQASWVKPLVLIAAAISFVVGIILAFIPGPAILFFAITAALVATQHHGLAKQLDRGELWVRKLLRSLRDKRRRA